MNNIQSINPQSISTSQSTQHIYILHLQKPKITSNSNPKCVLSCSLQSPSWLPSSPSPALLLPIMATTATMSTIPAVRQLLLLPLLRQLQLLHHPLRVLPLSPWQTQSLSMCIALPFTLSLLLLLPNTLLLLLKRWIELSCHGRVGFTAVQLSSGEAVHVLDVGILASL